MCQEGLASYRECEGTTCTCNLAIEEMNDDDIYEMMEEPMHRAMQVYPGREYISLINSHQKREKKENKNKEKEEEEEKRENEKKDKAGGKEKRRENHRLGFRNGIHHRPLSQEDNQRLMRIIAKLWCQGAADGHFVSMHSLNDPIFYTSHITFDRMAHYITLSPELRKRGFNMTWTTPRVPMDKKHSCLGSSIEHSTPFLPSLMTPVDPSFPSSPSSPSFSPPSSATFPLSEKGTDRDKDKDKDKGPPFTPPPTLPLLSEEDTNRHRDGDGGTFSPSDVGRSASMVSHEKASRRKEEKEEKSEAAMEKIDMHNEEKEEKEEGDLERLEGKGKDTTNEEEEQKKEELELSKKKEEVDTDNNEKEGEEEDEELEGFLSMRELDAMLHPLHPRLPYIYDDLTTWGKKVWKPKVVMEK